MIYAQNSDTINKKSLPTYAYKWELKINFHLPELNPEAIQIGLMQFDPSEKFMKDFDMKYLTEQLKNANDEKTKNMHINIQTVVTWDALFESVRGSELYLLSHNGTILSQAANYSNPKAKIWLVSKVFYLNEKPFAYAVPLNIENGATLEITLNNSNLISLIDLYKKIKK